MSKEVVFARQPILDREERLFGYELLFRGEKQQLTDRGATSLVLTGFLFSNFMAVLHRKLGFINIDETLLVSGTIESLPKEYFVIEVLEKVEISRVAHILEKHKKAGFQIALDDFVANWNAFDKYKKFFSLFDIVKFDALHEDLDEDALEKIVISLKKNGIKLLAEKIETKEQYDRFKELGFDYFQGYYFMKPQIARQKIVMPSKNEILKIWSMSEDEFEEIVEALKKSPELSFNILKLINSSYFNLQKEVASISQAVAYLGIKNLKKWLLLMFFAHEGGDFDTNPWVAVAVSRATFLNNIASRLELDSDKAYLVGMLSVLTEVLGEKEEILAEFPSLDEEIHKAIVAHETPYGLLLRIAQKLERGEFEKINNLVEDLEVKPEEIAKSYSSSLF
ncbi:EAL and HDOD domain-containing protein [Nitratiruptor tergarcus]|uniref:EAL and modified HD-GYP domain-containing signal transduction protein n=1 Tax=Nitratiruptor tergarcus DSM 16512 TaxID=1069081 RepID=A0A1W1WSN7_9BACT|nr:EAL domain-containing protein [Nitratiruptor tergarcus]SMC09212.1 EAL and modified HD-GYP domain-containing signal transduction protein [Nitratiruptor tergarcus DSM 16512]